MPAAVVQRESCWMWLGRLGRMFSNPNLTLFALLFLGNDAGEGEGPVAAWNTDGLGHET